MPHLLFSIAQWLNSTAWSTAIREGDWSFPVIETIHILGLGISVGTIAWIDLRLMGITMSGEPVADIVKQIEPIAIVGFIVMFISGSLLLLSEPLKCYTATAFRIKALLLILAGLNVLYFQSRLAGHLSEWDKGTGVPWQGKLVGLFSILLWFGIIIAGRWTAYL